MFVVRVVADEKTDYKAFSQKSGAVSRFDQGWRQTDDGEFRSIAIFEVVDVEDPRVAVDAVKSALPSVRLLALKEPWSLEVERRTGLAKLDLEL